MKWGWGSCCTDGMILGPLPLTNFCFNMKVHSYEGINAVYLGVDDAGDGTLHFKTITMADAQRGIIVCAETCKARYEKRLHGCCIVCDIV